MELYFYLENIVDRLGNKYVEEMLKEKYNVYFYLYLIIITCL